MTKEHALDPEARFERASAAFEAIHHEDPRQEAGEDGPVVPPSVAYHRALAAWVERLDPGASEALRLAARCQHIRRWVIPRSDFPAGGAGYKRWRARLQLYHAEQAAGVLEQAGYDVDLIQRVGALVRKQRLKHDPEVQLLEDAVCLTFLETELAEFAGKHPPDKVVSILRKTWDKMGPQGRAAAVGLVDRLPGDTRRLLESALAGGSTP